MKSRSRTIVRSRRTHVWCRTVLLSLSWRSRHRPEVLAESCEWGQGFLDPILLPAGGTGCIHWGASRVCLSQLRGKQAGRAQLAVESLGTTNEYAARVCSRIFWNSQVLASSSALLFSLTLYTPEGTNCHMA